MSGGQYLRTTQIDQRDLDQLLAPSVAWTSLEALHGLPLTPYDHDQRWNIHEGETTTLVLVDRFNAALLDWLKPRANGEVHLYAWATGPFTQDLHRMGIHVSLVIKTLMDAIRA